MGKIKVSEYRHPSWGTAFTRISEAFRKYSPENIVWVPNWEDSDIFIIHVVGEGEVPVLEREHPNKVIVQHCYWTAQIDRVDYIPFWKEAKLVISFHKLTDYTDESFNFHYMPWGADPDIFTYTNRDIRTVDVLTTGYIAKDECIDKLYEAAVKADKIVHHTGRNFVEQFGWDTGHYRHLRFMPILALAGLLNYTKYTSCLRLVEGFELLGVEGLFCGARPIVFDLPTYSAYKGFAYFVNHEDDIVEQLVHILSQEPEPITDSEYEQILKTFSWKVLVPKMFSRILEEI